MTNNINNNIIDEDTELLDYLNTSPYFVDFENEDSISRNRFRETFRKLPLDLQTLLASSKTADFIKSLSKKMSLNQSKTQLLTMAIRYIIVGEIYIKKMTTLISEALNINEEEARTLSNDVVNNLLMPVIEDIKKIHLNKFGKAGSFQMPEQRPDDKSTKQPAGTTSQQSEEEQNVVNLKN